MAGRYASIIVWSLAACIVLGCAAKASRPQVADDPTLADVSWLAGRWISEPSEREDQASSSEEHWTHAAGGTMLGVNRTIANGKTVFFEYLRIANTDQGIVYFASPAGRHPPTSFKLIEASPNHAAFENPEHDFPQRIIYRRDGDLLHARIEGLQNNQPAASQWTWRRVGE